MKNYTRTAQNGIKLYAPVKIKSPYIDKYGDLRMNDFESKIKTTGDLLLYIGSKF